MEETNDEQQEFLYKLSMSEQHSKQLQQQLQAIEENITELKSLDFELDEIPKSVGKEIRAPVGRGVFAKAKLISDELIVDVGNKNLVGKSVPETKEIIKEQIGKLEEVKKELEESVERINEELTDMLLEMQKKQEKG